MASQGASSSSQPAVAEDGDVRPRPGTRRCKTCDIWRPDAEFLNNGVHCKDCQRLWEGLRRRAISQKCSGLMKQIKLAFWRTGQRIHRAYRLTPPDSRPNFDIRQWIRTHDPEMLVYDDEADDEPSDDHPPPPPPVPPPAPPARPDDEDHGRLSFSVQWNGRRFERDIEFQCKRRRRE